MISGIVIPTCNPSTENTAMTYPRGEANLRCKHIVETLYSARITDITIVVDEEISLNNFSGFNVKIVYNPDAFKKVFKNIQIGLKNVSRDDIHGVMICPLDHPMLTQRLLVMLLQNFWQSKKQIIIPVFKGKWGFPVIYDVKTFSILENAEENESLLEVTKNHDKDIHEVEIQESGVVLKINSDVEFQKHLRD